jgi:hypothetical protein
LTGCLDPRSSRSGRPGTTQRPAGEDEVREQIFPGSRARQNRLLHRYRFGSPPAPGGRRPTAKRFSPHHPASKTLKVASSNDPSMRLYLRLGFEVIGTTEAYLQMEWRTAAPAPAGNDERIFKRDRNDFHQNL